MKNDLVTATVIAIVGVTIAYFSANFLTPALEDVTFSTLSTAVDSSLDEPDIEIFNYRAVNPTVEVYVGQCLEYNEEGECIDNNYTSSEEFEEGTGNGTTD